MHLKCHLKKSACRNSHEKLIDSENYEIDNVRLESLHINTWKNDSFFWNLKFVLIQRKIFHLTGSKNKKFWLIWILIFFTASNIKFCRSLILIQLEKINEKQKVPKVGMHFSRLLLSFLVQSDLVQTLFFALAI